MYASPTATEPSAEIAVASACGLSGSPPRLMNIGAAEARAARISVIPTTRGARGGNIGARIPFPRQRLVCTAPSPRVKSSGASSEPLDYPGRSAHDPRAALHGGPRPRPWGPLDFAAHLLLRALQHGAQRPRRYPTGDLSRLP